jgi:hypothetical protein
VVATVVATVAATGSDDGERRWSAGAVLVRGRPPSLALPLRERGRWVEMGKVDREVLGLRGTWFERYLV